MESNDAEYVRLTNKRKSTINLKSWTLRDKAGHTYKFASDFKLKPGDSVYIHTGKGANTSSHGARMMSNQGRLSPPRP